MVQTFYQNVFYASPNQIQRCTNELTHILVRLADPDDLDNAVSQLRGCDAGLTMNVVPLAQVFHAIQSLVNSTRLLLGCIAFVHCSWKGLTLVVATHNPGLPPPRHGDCG